MSFLCQNPRSRASIWDVVPEGKELNLINITVWTQGQTQLRIKTKCHFKSFQRHGSDGSVTLVTFWTRKLLITDLNNTTSYSATLRICDPVRSGSIWKIWSGLYRKWRSGSNSKNGSGLIRKVWSRSSRQTYPEQLEKSVPDYF